MSTLDRITREDQNLQLHFPGGSQCRKEDYAGGVITVAYDADERVVRIDVRRLDPPEMQVLSDLLRRHRLSLDSLVTNQASLPRDGWNLIGAVRNVFTAGRRVRI